MFAYLLNERARQMGWFPLLLAICPGTISAASEGAVSSRSSIAVEETGKVALGKSGNLPQHNSSRIEAKWTKLRGAEINLALSGKKVSPARDVGQAAMSYSEMFYPNGSWISVRRYRESTQFSGKWYVENDKLCVGTDGGQLHCRTVSRSEDNKSITMTDIGSVYFADKEIILKIEKIQY